jgi:glycosyltransferase involved in cell wall biosynthesis
LGARVEPPAGPLSQDRSRPSELLFVHASADLYGADIALLQLIAGLDRDRFLPTVIVPYDGPLVSRLREVGAEVIVYSDLPVLRRQHMNPRGLLELAISSVRSVRWLMGLIRQRNIAAVHSNTLAVLISGGLAARLARRPHVWHVHEILTHPRIVALALTTLSSALSTVVIANSGVTADHYRRTRLVGSTPVRVVPNGVDETRVRGGSGAGLRRLIGAGPEAVVFTLIGRVNRLKGHSRFLDAAERFLSEHAGDAYFLIVGDSFMGQEHFSDAVDKRIESSGTLRGRAMRVPHVADVAQVYAASDVIVVPSVEPESFGLVATEAMVASLPVIASLIGALPEVVDDQRTGILVEPGSSASLSAAMKDLGGSRARREAMGRAGRERFENNFRVGRYVEEFSEVYEEVIEDGRDDSRSGSIPHAIVDGN